MIDQYGFDNRPAATMVSSAKGTRGRSGPRERRETGHGTPGPAVSCPILNFHRRRAFIGKLRAEPTGDAMIQDIVVNLAVGRSHDPAVAYAASLAKTLEAELSGIAFRYEPIVMADAMEVVPADIIEAQRLENAKAAENAVANFKRVTAKIDLPVEMQIVQTDLGEAPKVFARIARRFDLSVVSQPEPGPRSPEQPVIEAALFDSGRPIIIVPYIQTDGLKLDHVMVCWDGSRTAARALADAMPLLEFAKTAEIITVGEAYQEEPFADIRKHFARHGLKADLKQIASADDVASTILSHAADSSADVIVMGGYGHSRLREFVLGGVTREILKTMTVPVLMSH